MGKTHKLIDGRVIKVGKIGAIGPIECGTTNSYQVVFLKGGHMVVSQPATSPLINIANCRDQLIKKWEGSDKAVSTSDKTRKDEPSINLRELEILRDEYGFSKHSIEKVFKAAFRNVGNYKGSTPFSRGTSVAAKYIKIRLNTHDPLFWTVEREDGEVLTVKNLHISVDTFSTGETDREGKVTKYICAYYNGIKQLGQDLLIF